MSDEKRWFRTAILVAALFELIVIVLVVVHTLRSR